MLSARTGLILSFALIAIVMSMAVSSVIMDAAASVFEVIPHH